MSGIRDYNLAKERGFVPPSLEFDQLPANSESTLRRRFFSVNNSDLGLFEDWALRRRNCSIDGIANNDYKY